MNELRSRTTYSEEPKECEKVIREDSQAGTALRTLGHTISSCKGAMRTRAERGGKKTLSSAECGVEAVGPTTRPAPPAFSPPPLAGRLLPRLLGAAAGALYDKLRSHGIPATAAVALDAGDPILFLVERERFLRLHVEGFLAARARWAESDRPSLRAALVSDEEI